MKDTSTLKISQNVVEKLTQRIRENSNTIFLFDLSLLDLLREEEREMEQGSIGFPNETILKIRKNVFIGRKLLQGEIYTMTSFQNGEVEYNGSRISLEKATIVKILVKK